MSRPPILTIRSIPPPRRKSASGVSDRRPGASRLLELIGKIIAVGRERLAMALSRPGPEEKHQLAICLGTFNLVVIVGRLIRGLRLAKLLEERVTANAARIDTPPRHRMAAPRIAPHSPRKPKPSDAEDAAALLRNRPIGAVLVDICRDLGIHAGHPLWAEQELVILHHNGDIAVIQLGAMPRVTDAYQEIRAGLVPDSIALSKPASTGAATGPPLSQAA